MKTENYCYYVCKLGKKQQVFLGRLYCSPTRPDVQESIHCHSWSKEDDGRCTSFSFCLYNFFAEATKIACQARAQTRDSYSSFNKVVVNLHDVRTAYFIEAIHGLWAWERKIVWPVNSGLTSKALLSYWSLSWLRRSFWRRNFILGSTGCPQHSEWIARGRQRWL